MSMLRICGMSILFVTLTFGASSLYEEDEGDISRLIHNERRLIEPATVSAIVATISAIAGSTTAAVNLAKQFEIDDDGAQFQINNYFKDIQLHHKGTHRAEGTTIQPASILIKEGTTENSGGAFNDDGPGESAGYVQYEITNPISLQRYCYGYLWGSEANSVFGSGTGGNWIVAAIRQRQCPSESDGFNDLKYALQLGISKSIENCVGHLKSIPITISIIDPMVLCASAPYNLNYAHYSADSSYRAMHVLRARDDGFSISSIDTKIGMTLHVSTPDGDEDHPTIIIDVGPYKKIFGNAMTGNYNIFREHNWCEGGAKNIAGATYIGQFPSATQCHIECRRREGDDCKYFEFYHNGGHCTIFSGAVSNECYQNPGNTDYILYSHISYLTEYDMLEDGQYCTGHRSLLGTYSTTDECWDKCKALHGDNCQYFTFSIQKDNFGECHFESECGPGRYVKDTNYNLYGKLKKNDE